MRPSSSEDEDRSTTGTFSEGPPCSNTDEQGRREEISDGDPGGGGDPDSTGGGVEPPLGEEEPSLAEEQEHLFPLLSSIVSKRRGREENPKQRREEIRDGYRRKMTEIFIACEVSPTRVRHFENCASCVGYLDGQANCLTLKRNVHRDVTVV
jgi:hypothetical protein